MSEVIGDHNEGAPLDGATASDDGDSDLLTRVRAWHKRGRSKRHKWVADAGISYAYVSGDQWEADDRRALDEQGRPAITFNRIGPFVDGVCGLEIGNRQEQRAIPRTMDPQPGGEAELMSNCIKWARDECDADDEESAQFRDMIICGEGWTETRMDYTANPDGVPVVERIDPLEIIPDPASSAQNYTDARWIMRAKDVSLPAAREMAPGFSDYELDATWARDEPKDEGDIPDANISQFYEGQESDDLERTRTTVTLVEVEWWETETTYRVSTEKGGVQTMGADNYSVMRKRGLRGPAVRDRKRVYKYALVGRTVLIEEDGPEVGFRLKGMTGKRDVKAGCWYGLVRAMQDPQMWANKWLSQILHIINTMAKAGLIAEQDAFVNKDEAADTWAETGAITWLNPGGLAKIKEKEMASFPAGMMEMTQMAIAAIPAVTGVSPEMMGQADRDQPASLEMQRKQQGMTLLAGFFNAQRRYRKEQGRLLVWFIQNFLPDRTMIRIAGQDDAQFVPFMRDRVMMDYDLLVDDTPSSPNMKERTWGMLTQLFPVLAKMNLPPQAMIELFKYSPLPDTLVSKIAQMAQQAAMGQQGDPHAAALAQEAQAKVGVHQAQAQKLQAETQKIAAESGVAVSKMQADIEAQKASAIANLAKAGVSVAGTQLDAASSAADSLLTMHQQVHDQAMDRANFGAQQQQAAMAAQQQGHQQGMDVAQFQQAGQQGGAQQALAERAQGASEDQAAQQAQIAQQAAQAKAGQP